MYRTHHCNQLRKTDINQTITLAGWVNSRRDHGGVIFIDLRDREGLTQVVFRPEEHPQVAEASHGLRSEDVIQVTGKVAARLAGTENPKLATGDIEVIASELRVLNKADVPPFPLDDPKVNEDLRLEYRYLDLRTAHMQQNLKLRHRIVKATRDFLDEHGFLEIETPILSNPTPEGARDFLVPSRLTPGIVLRAAAGAAAIQATAASRGAGEVFPDRALLPRRGSARRPPAGVHADRRRGVVHHRRGNPDRSSKVCSSAFSRNRAASTSPRHSRA